MDYFFVMLALLIALGVPLVAIVLSIIAFVRTRRVDELSRQVERLEEALRSQTAEGPPRPAPRHALPPTERPPEEVVTAEVVLPSKPARPPIQWELLIGQKALGWVAVLLLIFAAAFFLRYAYQNNWIGPVGRVAIGALVGATLIVLGRRYYLRGWRVLSQMVISGGIVVLYLATYSAFGFYHLLPQRHAGIFLAIVIAESMILAALFDSWAIGLVAVLGGLLTPMLLQTDRDSYQALFIYLGALNAGTVLLMFLRAWPAICTVSLLGTQSLFWIWYDGNYHPEKLAWALGFQAAIYLIYLACTVIPYFVRRRRETWEGIARLVMNAILWFAAFYILMQEDYGIWMGSAAVGMATLYAVLAQLMLSRQPIDARLLLSSLAVALGFVVLAFPIQADARWVALGWAAMAAALWWFGLRISAISLRAIAAALAGAAVFRVVVFDLPYGVREMFTPVFNEFALPSAGVALCILTAVAATKPYWPRLRAAERFLVGTASVVGILLLWLILSVDCYDYFESRSAQFGVDREHWLWLGQLSLSVLWAVYASALLAIGFRFDFARLRWLAIGLYAVTVAKVFLVDMANLRQIYRILAFLILAIILGLAARAYQRLRPPAVEDEGAET